MTINYAYFKQSNMNPPKITMVHAFDSLGTWGDTYPMCNSLIDIGHSLKIPIKLEDTHSNDLCGNCIRSLEKKKIKWWEIVRDYKRGDSDEIENVNHGDSLEVDISRETTDKIVYNLGDYTLTMTLFDGEFSSAVLRDNKTERIITIISDVNLVKLFMLLYRGLDTLGVLSDEVAESLSQFVFDNKNK